MINSKTRQKTLVKEVKLLRSFMIGVAGKDAEGAYRPEFVQRVFSTINDRPTHRFQSAKSFFDQLASS